MLKNHPDAPTVCRVVQDFSLGGLWYRVGQEIVFRRLQASLLSEAGKVRVLVEEKPNALPHVRFNS